MPSRPSRTIRQPWHAAVLVLAVALCWLILFVAACCGTSPESSVTWPLAAVTVVLLVLIFVRSPSSILNPVSEAYLKRGSGERRR